MCTLKLGIYCETNVTFASSSCQTFTFHHLQEKQWIIWIRSKYVHISRYQIGSTRYNNYNTASSINVSKFVLSREFTGKKMNDKMLMSVQVLFVLLKYSMKCKKFSTFFASVHQQANANGWTNIFRFQTIFFPCVFGVMIILGNLGVITICVMEW